MTSTSLLEQRLKILLAEYDQLKKLRAELTETVTEYSAQIKDLKDANLGLRLQIDDLSKERFVLKRLRDERKTLKRKLGLALERLARLERELMG